MARAISNKRAAASETNALHRRREVAAALVAVLGARTAVEYAATYLIKNPVYNSILTGAAWIQELLDGHATRFYEALGMAKPVFVQICHELQEYCGLHNSRYLGLAEKVAIFLRMCQTGDSHREIRERFQHAPGTISMYVCVHFVDGDST